MKVSAFIPIFLLFFNFVFGVAAELYDGFQLVIRISALLFCVSYAFISNVKGKVEGYVLFLFFCLYLISVFVFNFSLITLNFIYLSVIIFYFKSVKLSLELLISNAFYVTVIVLGLFCISIILGIVTPSSTEIGGRLRYSFGFSNANKVGIVAYSLYVLVWLNYFFNNKNLKSVVFFSIVSFSMAYFSDSRTSLYSIVIFSFLCVFALPKIIRRFMFILPLLFLLVSFYISTLSNEFSVNLLLSNRPVDFNNFMKNLEFINYITGASSEGDRVDNSYILAYFSVGPLLFLLFLFRCFQFSNYEHHKSVWAFFVSLLLYAIFEALLVRVEFPLVLIFYYMIFFSNKTKC